jgi:hypothetical protein
MGTRWIDLVVLSREIASRNVLGNETLRLHAAKTFSKILNVL